MNPTTPLQRAFESVNVHNERHVSLIYGDSAMTHVSTMFGAASPEAEAYADWMSEGNALNEVYQQNLRAKEGLEHWAAADEARLQESKRAVDAHFARRS